MNAYELADWLTEHSFLKDTDIAMMPVINMLRQQADRIAELTAKAAELEKQNEPVAWIAVGENKNVFFDLDTALSIDANPIPLYTTPQTKPLNNEPIIPFQRWSKEQDLVDSWKNLDNTPQTKPLSDGEILKMIGDKFTKFGFEADYVFDDMELLEFARAIEAKVRGEK
jgi:hypothetical protein